MAFIGKVVSALEVANKVFNEGANIAKAIFKVCIIGAMATAMAIGQLIGISNENDNDNTIDTMSLVDEPP